MKKKIEKFRLAEKNEFEAIFNLYNKTKIDQLKKNILQWGYWDKNYPNKEFIINHLNKKVLFVLLYSNKIIGAVVLNQEQSIEWNDIKWTGDIDKSLVIHAMIIDPKMQGRGFGSKFLEFCEQQAIIHGLKYIRLDAFKKNIISNRLYQSRKYKNLGTVIFDKKPDNNKKYYCYEKIL